MATANPVMVFSLISDEIHPDPNIAFPVAAALGSEYISVRNIGPKGSARKFHELTDDDVGLVKKLAGENGLNVAIATSPLGKVKFSDVQDGNPAPYMQMDGYLAEFVPRCVDTARRLGAPMIRIFTGYPPRGSNPRDYFNQSVDLVGGILERCREKGKPGLVAGVEYEQDLAAPDAESLMRLLDQLKDYSDSLCLIWDGGNVVATARDPAAEYGIMKSRIGAIHSKDLKLPPELRQRVRREHRVDESELRDFVPIGGGDAAYDRVLAAHARFPDRRHWLYRDRATGALVPSFCMKGLEAVLGDYQAVVPNDLEPHLAEGGQFGGTSGPRNAGLAYNKAVNVAYRAGWVCIG